MFAPLKGPISPVPVVRAEAEGEGLLRHIAGDGLLTFTAPHFRCNAFYALDLVEVRVCR